MVTMAWADAEVEFASFFSKKSQFVFQFHDARAAMGAVGGSKRVFTTSHPSDFIVIDEGHWFYAEVKSCSNPTSFPFANVKVSQWSAAVQATAAGGDYFFFIRHETVTRNLYQWYKVPAHILLNNRKCGAKSIGWDELRPYMWRL